MLKKVSLENGVRIVSEKIPYVRSVSIGIWVGTGSRNESTLNNGISHFIEHMLFKGTENRSAKEIAESMDNIGGQLNAFTGKECTCFYTKILDEHLDIAIDVLSDMFFNSKFAARDLNVERKVILEEISMYEDAPEELVHDLLFETIWEGDALGYPILGTAGCLKKINKNRISEYMDFNYLPGNTLISVAGNFDDEKMLELVSSRFSSWNSKNGSTLDYSKPRFVKQLRVKEKETELVHLCMGFDALEHGDDRLYTLLALNNILGGGMSSRLFQKIRERLGLAYSIYSYPSSYKKAGLFSIYAGMKPEQLEKVVNLIIKEIKLLKRNGLKQEELIKSKEQLKGSYILGLESTSSRMNSIGKSELLLGYINSQEEILNKIESITMEDVESVIKQIFDFEKMGIAVIGNISKDINIDGLLE